MKTFSKGSKDFTSKISLADVLATRRALRIVCTVMAVMFSICCAVVYIIEALKGFG